jgi:uncharacterized integral membrane protein
VLIQAALNTYWASGEATGATSAAPATTPTPATSGSSLALVLVAMLAAYVLAFLLLNDENMEIDFLFDTREIPMRLLVFLLGGLGFLAGVLLSRALRGRAAEHGPSEPTRQP